MKPKCASLVSRVWFLSVIATVAAANAQDAARDEYHRFAYVLSDPYIKADGAYAGRDSLEPTVSRFAKSATEPAIRRASNRFLDAGLFANGISMSKQAASKAIADAEESQEALAETRRRAARGAYTRKETYEEPFGSSGQTFTRVEYVDDSDAAILWAELGAGRSVEGRYRQERGKLVNRSELCRVQALKEIIPTLALKHSGPLSEKPLVELMFRPAGPSDARKPPEERIGGQHLATNVSGRELINVTLAVDSCHYSSLPAATGRHFYFIGTWPPGETIQLGNVLRVGSNSAYNVLHAGMLKRDSRRPVPFDLCGMMGVVRMRATVWSDQARQDPTSFDLPDRIDAVGRQLIKELEVAASLPEGRVPGNYVSFVDPSQTLPANRRMGATAKPQKQTPVQILGDSILAFAPVGSELETDAKKLMGNPLSAKAAAKARLKEDMLKACEAGQRYRGNMRGGGTTKPVVLTFDERNDGGSRVTATLGHFGSNAPTVPMSGNIVWNEGKDAYVVQLRLGKRPNAKPKNKEEASMLNWLAECVPTMSLVLTDGNLVGTGKTYANAGLRQLTNANVLVSFSPEK